MKPYTRDDFQIVTQEGKYADGKYYVVYRREKPSNGELEAGCAVNVNGRSWKSVTGYHDSFPSYDETSLELDSRIINAPRSRLKSPVTY